MAEKKKFYLTTAIAYTSGKPHIGNTYEAVLADKGDEYKAEEVDFNCSYLKITPEMVKDCMDAIKDCDEDQWLEESNGYTKYECLKLLSDVHLKMVYGECPLDFYVMPWW